MLSIIIPLYNNSSTIERCLHAIATQRRSHDCQVIVVDDGSDNNEGYTLAQQWMTRRVFHPTSQVLTQSHSGAATARNRGLSVAEGEWVWMIDADDSVVEGSLSVLMDLIALLPADCNVLKCGRMLIDDEAVPATASDYYAVQPHTPIATLMTHLRGVLDHTTYLFRHSFLQHYNIGYPTDRHMLEDSTFVVTVLSHCTTIAYAPTLYCYRCYRCQSSHQGVWNPTLRTARMADILLFFHTLRQYVEAPSSTPTRAGRLYVRYRYVYQRTLPLKGYNWKALQDFARQTRFDCRPYGGTPTLAARLMSCNLSYRLYYLLVKAYLRLKPKSTSTAC